MCFGYYCFKLGLNNQNWRKKSELNKPNILKWIVKQIVGTRKSKFQSIAGEIQFFLPEASGAHHSG